MEFDYPPSERQDLVETLHGQTVADPYRWLEELESPATEAWIAAQNELTERYLDAHTPRTEVQERVERLWNYEKFGVPLQRGERLFYTYNDGLQDQAVLLWQEDRQGQSQVLVDPNTLSDDGTVALVNFVPSKDGRLVAYGLATAGSDWQTWRVRRVDDGSELDDQVDWVKFSAVSWTADHKGFYYSRYDAPGADETYKAANYYNKLYYHRLGTAQSADRLVYERSDQKEWGFDGHVTDDGRYLIIHVWMGTHRRNAVFYQDLTGASDQVVELLSAFDAAYLFVGNAGSQFYFQTDLDAPNGRVIAIDIERPEPTAWRTVVPEHDDALETASLIGERFVATYLRHAHSRLVVMDGDGRQVAEAPLPGIGTVTLVRGNQDQADAYYHFASFVQPGMVLHYDVETGLQHVFREPELPFDPEAFTTQQIFFKSKDGTRIPMFITSHNERSGSEVRPTLLHGYGGFNLAKTPSFLVAALAWMEMGGVFAQASLRGGGEYGKGWHDAGRLGNKQNVFDDFIAAAEYLIAEGYTRPEKLAIWGRSNGGLLVGACMSQRPELFGAAVPQVGVLDMLRFHKFTIGWAWISDYGSPEKPDDFETLLAYSPYHNLEADTVYPATLILTGDHDDRVYPAHSFKFAAALQAAARQNEAPILIRIETRTGHGVGKPTAMLIAEVADMLAFLKHALAGS